MIFVFAKQLRAEEKQKEEEEQKKKIDHRHKTRLFAFKWKENMSREDKKKRSKTIERKELMGIKEFSAVPL